MKAVAPLTRVLEHVYAPEADTQAWLEGIRRAAGRAFDGHLDAQAYLLRMQESRFELERVASDARYAAAIADSHTAGADPRVINAYRAGGPVMRARDLYRRIGASHPTRAMAIRAGVMDVVGCVGFADPSRVCVISFVLADEQTRFSRAARLALSRLSAHLAASHRLRLRAGDVDEAVLTPDGALLDASGDAKDRGSRERLRQAAIRTVRAKRESAHDPAASLAFWTAMVDGRWTLVERVDTDGKRLLIAKRNQPDSIADSALTERERIVVERASLGGSVRHVAYELGLAESTVSETVSRALKKLGIRTRAELIELRASLA